MEITITEALSELNLIKKKIEKKRQTVTGMLVMGDHMKDPMADKGGSENFVKSEMQSIEDLQSRFVRIKGAIAKANVETQLTINEQTKTIHDWLIWKREIAEKEVGFCTTIYQGVKSQFDRLSTQPQVYKDDEGNTKVLQLKALVDHTAALKRGELVTDTFDKLDGQLSLKNATIKINIQ